MTEGGGQKLPASVLAFEDFLNEPSQFEDMCRVRDYRHEAYPKWQAVLKDIRAMLASLPAQDTDAPDRTTGETR